MDANLQVKAPMLALGAEIARSFPHADCDGNGAVWCLEGRHHRIANRLHNGALSGAYDLLKQPEMLTDKIEGGNNYRDTFKFSADDFPRFSMTSYSMACPSLSVVS
jgi:hypothetical protein